MLNNMEEACLSVKVTQQHYLITFPSPGMRWCPAPEEELVASRRTCIVWVADGGMIVKGDLSIPDFAYDQGLIELKSASRMGSYVVIKD